MKRALGLAIVACGLMYAPVSLAAPQWVEVIANAVGDRFFVDTNSIERKGENAWYWEYREFKQPNNAFLETAVDQPVYGVVLYRSVDCNTKVERLRRVTAYDQKRNVIRKFSYDDKGRLNKPMEGSSAAAVLRFVCSKEGADKPAPSADEQK